MFRSLFILLSKVNWAQKLIMNWEIARRMATRFVAGDTLEDAIKAIQVLNSTGIYATLDHLGENTETPADAEAATQAILSMITAIDSNQVQSNVSIKLSQIGFSLDEKLCENNLRTILTYAKSKDLFIRIDMEDSSTVDRTIALYKKMRQEGFDRVGLVIQSYLYRSEADVKDLLKLNTPIRICKGAYQEPASVAFPQKKDVDDNYDKIVALLMEGSLAAGSLPDRKNGCNPPIPGIATHDEKRIEYTRKYAEKIRLSLDAFEFQMLYGIRRDLQQDLVKRGYHVRIYVPYGTQWYPYFMRRLAERPANIWFIMSNLFRR